MKHPTKKLSAFRLRQDVVALLKKLSSKTNKSKTRLIEEAVLLHTKDL